MRTIATLFLLIIGLHSASQRACTAVAFAYHNAPNAGKSLAAANSLTRQQTLQNPFGLSVNTNAFAAEAVIRIPVVVHVVYNTAAENISDEQIKSQIAALNRDYRRRNSDSVNTPERFKPFAADAAIEFVLASADPLGKPTTGIVRTKTSVKSWSLDDKIKKGQTGGADSWDSKSYLNIWVGNMAQVLGYASLPGADAVVDGVVINFSAFGTIGTAAPYNMGRTAVHEVGHWLGLKHIWGDAACGDDGVDDTPKQGTFTTGSPSGFRSSCSNAPLGDMYMNFMDFTNDAAMNLFTYGQKAKMRSLFNPGGARSSLLQSKGLSLPWVEEPVLPEPIATAPQDVAKPKSTLRLFPNPAVSEATVQLDATWTGKTLQLVNINGTVLQQIAVTAPVQSFSVARLTPGVYFLQGTNGFNRISHKLVKL